MNANSSINNVVQLDQEWIINISDTVYLCCIAGYYCEFKFIVTLKKLPPVEISAIAKFARQEHNFHWIMCQENSWQALFT